jgi:spermidine synthase
MAHCSRPWRSVVTAVRALLFMLGVAMLAGYALAADEQDLIESVESIYNNIFVYENDGVLMMTFGHNKRLYVESKYNKNEPRELPVTYTRYMTLGVLYPQKLDSLLFIGLGGGRTSWYLHENIPDLAVTVVEIDPEVVRLAEAYFAISEEENYQVEESDGRLYATRNEGPWDLIMVDAYRGPFVPFHLLTTEFYGLLRSRLSEGGAVVQNIEPTTMLFEGAAATMDAIFDNVDYYDAGGNVVAVAYDGPKKTDEGLAAAAEAAQQRYGFFHDVRPLLGKRRGFTVPADLEPLTDDFAPVEYLKATERHNMKWDETP